MTEAKISPSDFKEFRLTTHEDHELLADDGSVLRMTAEEVIDKHCDGDEGKGKDSTNDDIRCVASETHHIGQEWIRTKNDGEEETAMAMTEDQKEDFWNRWEQLWRPILK